MPPKQLSSSRKRAYHPKSRSGCWSCRSRKVKCDESKPSCKRCQVYGMRCAGYSPVRPIYSAYCALLDDQADSSIQRAPSIPLMSSILQEQYFKLFFSKSQTAIVPYFGVDKWGNKWRTVVTEACSSEPALFHAIVAIGALEKTCEVVRIEKAAGLTTTNPHHEFALKEYGKAIKMMRKSSQDGLQDLRTVLLITIFIICFEELHGNYESSTGQIMVALKMIEEWKQKYDKEDNHGFCFSSPAPYEIPNGLLQIFGRLEIQTMLFVDTRPPEKHVNLKRSGDAAVNNMPEVFKSVGEARMYLDLIMRRFMHWIAQIGHGEPLKELPRSQNVSPLLENTDSQIKEEWKPAYIVKAGRNMMQASSRAELPLVRTVLDVHDSPGFHRESPDIQKNLHPNPYGEGRLSIFMKPSFFFKPSATDYFSDTIYMEQNAHMSELFTWRRAFDPLCAALVDQDHPHVIGISLLKLHFLLGCITLGAKLSSQEAAYDEYTAEFAEALALCSFILTKLAETSEVQSSLHFTFDHGVLIPLYLIMTKCRVSALRKDALLLTRTHQRREGCWDSELTAAVAGWVIRVEDQGILEDGSVPERARVSHINLKAHSEKRKAVISCQRWSDKDAQFGTCVDTIYW